MPLQVAVKIHIGPDCLNRGWFAQLMSSCEELRASGNYSDWPMFR